MKQFGPKAWMRDEIARMKTPRGALCERCGEPIRLGDDGAALPKLTAPGEVTECFLHRACFIRGMVGSVGHQLKQCSCFGGSCEDPEGLTPREAAEAAMSLALATTSVEPGEA